ncbi:cytochrome c oxidase subunit 6A1, mitochondrial-like [Dromiciops gliroides]|uniref:cytochrome c oxidase subunit 6A1, mitochondrial-like n=1 Tax=Dromiciops gliroides TaxID=33562 RepID=UPI001CC40DED|nr:cytochrome c oxidase subunit 6A1, mitochondrial-like [Dromiciops gliroides]
MAVTASSRLLLGQVRTPAGQLFSRCFYSEEGSGHLWRMQTFFVMLPRVAVSMLNAYLKLWEHHEWPHFVPYPLLHSRTKTFPWGDGNHTHDHHINPLPTGYKEGAKKTWTILIKHWGYTAADRPSFSL